MNMQTEYIKRLLENGQDNLHICPDCYAAGRRKHLCKNMVFNKSAQALVCCYLGLKEVEENVTLEDATEIVRRDQEAYRRGTLSEQAQQDITSVCPNALREWDEMNKESGST
jgi:hypothetical protein